MNSRHLKKRDLVLVCANLARPIKRDRTPNYTPYWRLCRVVRIFDATWFTDEQPGQH